MDTSNKYIEMCGSANELQLKWEPRQGDFASCLKTGFILKHLPREGESLSWLPRQDQLLDMLKGTHTVGAVLQGLYEFYEPEHFCPDADNDVVTCGCEALGVERRKGLDTIEQFALAYVMDELYKKRWDGTMWKGDYVGKVA
jgi:hypothetical protein